MQITNIGAVPTGLWPRGGGTLGHRRTHSSFSEVLHRMRVVSEKGKEALNSAGQVASSKVYMSRQTNSWMRPWISQEYCQVHSSSCYGRETHGAGCYPIGEAL